jgi:PIN domain nuclease of toxin-antitoxin system
VRVLLDTHVLLWWLHDSARLRSETRALLASSGNELLWSAASTWELAIKAGLGRVQFKEPLRDFVVRICAEQSLVPLPIQHAHAARVVDLPLLHRDPFDRLLVAQAAVEGVPFVTADAQLSGYGIECMPA